MKYEMAIVTSDTAWQAKVDACKRAGLPLLHTNTTTIEVQGLTLCYSVLVIGLPDTENAPEAPAEEGP